MSNVDLAILFFMQVVIILVTCRIVGAIAAKFGQPQVVAEMIAGVTLGPSLFGLLAPQLQEWLFPWDTAQQTRDTSAYLFPASQLGLAVYMFTVGMEFRSEDLRQHAKASAAVSIAGMVAPFILGAAVGALIFRIDGLFGAETSRTEAMIFTGASLCITAFPMLARIIRHHRLTESPMGTVALGAGAIDDAVAWGLLAVVLASFEQDPMTAFASIGGGLFYVAVVFAVVRPLFRSFASRMIGVDNQPTESALVIALAAMAAGAAATDAIGLHAVFGAFVMGTAIPRGALTTGLSERIEPLTVALLLPLFFTYSGLNTRIDLLNSWSGWGVAGLVLLAAIVGKGGACWAAARWCGLSNRESIGVAALMNSRGLMELIIINIGLQRGILGKELFAVFVLMAITTTLMATPIFNRWCSADKGLGDC